MSIEYIRIEPEEMKVGEYFTLIVGVINDHTDLNADGWLEVKQEKSYGSQVRRTNHEHLGDRMVSGGKYEYRKDFRHEEDEVRLHATVSWTTDGATDVGVVDRASVDVKTKPTEVEKTPFDFLFDLLGSLLPQASSIGPPLPKFLGARWVPKYSGGSP